MKLLLGIPSPRDIVTFKEHINVLKVDKLWLKYYKELDAYQRIRNYFLKHDYSHLVICPDDLIVKPYNLTRLIHDFRRHDYPILCGLCNIDGNEANKNKTILTPTGRIPHIQPNLRTYHWMSAKAKPIREQRIFQVSYAGFPFFGIRRDVVEQIHFKDDDTSCCIDVVFCNDCHRFKIPIMVDPKINMLHLKRADSNYDQYQVGTKKPFTYMERLSQ